MKNEFNFLIVILLLIVPVKAQSSETNLTGNLSADSKILFEENNFESLPQLSFQTENKKSPLLAGILSLVLPGAGEFYVGDYLKTAIFLTIEELATVKKTKKTKMSSDFIFIASSNI